MSFHYFIIFVSLWTATDQSILMTVTQVDYSIEPKYGNLTSNTGNSTHSDAVNLWFHVSVSNFILYHSFENDLGKEIYTSTYNPCNRKDLSTMTRMMTMITGGKMTAKDIPITWNCPIRKGLMIVKSLPRELKFSFYVPSFFASEGNYSYKVSYKASGKKSEVFMKSVTQYNMKAIKD